MGMGNIARLGASASSAFRRFVLPSRPIVSPVVSNARLEPARRNNLLGLRLFALALVIGEVGSLAGRRVTAEPKVIAAPKIECGANSCVLTVPMSPQVPKIKKVDFTAESGLRINGIDNDGDNLSVEIDTRHAQARIHEGVLNEDPNLRFQITIGEAE